MYEPALFKAIVDGDECATAALLPKADLGVTDGSGWTVLHRAAWHDRAKLVTTLINAGAHVNATSPDGFSVLRVAAIINSFDIIELLLQAGAEPDLGFWTQLGCKFQDGVLVVQDRAPLVFNIAVSHGHIHLVKSFLHIGISPNTVNYLGWPSITTAIAYGHISVLKLLLDTGADPDASVDVTKYKAIHMAVKYSHLDAINLLISRGVSIHATDWLGRSAMHYAVDVHSTREALDYLLSHMTILADSLDNDGLNALHLAAVHGVTGVVANERLLARLSSTTSRDGKTALQLAQENKQTKVVAILKAWRTRKRAAFLSCLNPLLASPLRKLPMDIIEIIVNKIES